MKAGSKHTEETKQKIREKMLNSLNAEYWTAELVEATLFEMLEFLNKEYEIEVSVKTKSGVKGDYDFTENSTEKRKRRHHTKTTLLQKFDILDVDWFANMSKKFKHNETIFRVLRLISEICENNVYNDAANGAVNAGVASLLLMTKHNWKEKKETKEEEKSNIDLSKLTDEELRIYLELANKCTTDTSGDG